jgi:hypothetical protein
VASASRGCTLEPTKACLPAVRRASQCGTQRGSGPGRVGNTDGGAWWWGRQHGNTALMCMACQGQLELCKKLVAAGADPYLQCQVRARFAYEFWRPVDSVAAAARGEGFAESGLTVLRVAHARAGHRSTRLGGHGLRVAAAGASVRGPLSLSPTHSHTLSPVQLTVPVRCEHVEWVGRVRAVDAA